MLTHYTSFFGGEGRDVGQKPEAKKTAASADGVPQPMAFLVEQSPNSQGRPHFHRVDQWQVFVRGSGTLGRHAVTAVSLHYAGAFTTYGPIVAGDEGVSYFTLRNAYDYGAQYMPDSREELLLHRQTGRREALAGPDPAMPADALAQMKHCECRAVVGPEPDGLAAWRICAPPSGITEGPSPGLGQGQSWVVLSGMLLQDGQVLPELSCLFVHPDDAALKIEAGPQGVELLCLQYPQHRKRSDASLDA